MRFRLYVSACTSLGVHRSNDNKSGIIIGILMSELDVIPTGSPNIRLMDCLNFHCSYTDQVHPLLVISDITTTYYSKDGHKKLE